MIRNAVLAGTISLLAAAAIAAPLLQAAPAVQAEQPSESPTAEAFAAALVDGINAVLADNPTLTDFVELETLLEQVIEGVFLSSNVSPEAALAGVEQARTTLLASGAMCDLPDGPATSRCEAVALAFVIAREAALAAQSDPVGSIGSNAGSALGGPPSTGSGGGGGGVTHPPVSQ